MVHPVPPGLDPLNLSSKLVGLLVVAAAGSLSIARNLQIQSRRLKNMPPQIYLNFIVVNFGLSSLAFLGLQLIVSMITCSASSHNPRALQRRIPQRVGNRSRAVDVRDVEMVVLRLLLSAIFISLSVASIESEQSTCASRCTDGSSLSCELQDLKLKLAQLGTLFFIRISSLAAILSFFVAFHS